MSQRELKFVERGHPRDINIRPRIAAVEQNGVHTGVDRSVYVFFERIADHERLILFDADLCNGRVECARGVY